MIVNEELNHAPDNSDDSSAEEGIKLWKELMDKQDHFKVYLNILKDDSTQMLELESPPSLMGIDEPELSFKAPVLADGEAYIAGEELILHLNAKTEGIIPCSICSEPVTVPLECNGFYHAVPLNEIKENFYDFRDIIRENLLLEVPSFIECKGGKCPERENLKKYFKQGDSLAEKDEGQQPFSNLSL